MTDGGWKSPTRRMLTQNLKGTSHPLQLQGYQQATNNEIPDRWWQTYQKLS